MSSASTVAMPVRGMPPTAGGFNGTTGGSSRSSSPLHVRVADLQEIPVRFDDTDTETPRVTPIPIKVEVAPQTTPPPARSQGKQGYVMQGDPAKPTPKVASATAVNAAVNQVDSMVKAFRMSAERDEADRVNIPNLYNFYKKYNDVFIAYRENQLPGRTVPWQFEAVFRDNTYTDCGNYPLHTGVRKSDKNAVPYERHMYYVIRSTFKALLDVLDDRAHFPEAGLMTALHKVLAEGRDDLNYVNEMPQHAPTPVMHLKDLNGKDAEDKDLFVHGCDVWRMSTVKGYLAMYLYRIATRVVQAAAAKKDERSP